MVQLKQVLGATTRAALAVMLICLASGQAAAGSARSWVLETQSGQVQLVKTGISPIALTPGDAFGGGDWIETGPDGRAVLRRGEETIVVAPNSRIGLPKDKTGPFATRILHTLGTILLTVEKKAKQHFEVQTPYLTAVVKGTTFTVGIQNGRSVVHVVEGLVQVKNLASGRSTLVRPGQTGAVMRNGAADVQVEGGVADSAPVDQAVSAAPAVSETVTQAVSAAPVASAATQVVSTASTVETRRNSGVIKIKQALGPKTLDLSKSTRGLVRAASRAAPQAAVGARTASDLTVKSGVTSVRAKGGKALAQTANATAKGGLSKATGTGRALGRVATATASLSNATGNGLALGQSAGARANAGLSDAVGNGRALGQSVGASLASDNGNGRGLAVGQGLNPNPGLGQSNAGGNGNGKAKGHEK